MPLVGNPLSEAEKTKLLERINHLLGYLGAPGDWGYETKLGVFTEQLYSLRSEVQAATTRSTS